MKKVLVTGANGQLGLSIQDIQQDFQGLELVYKDRSELDITNIIQVKDVFESENFDYCINCAAYTDVEQAEKTPNIAYKVNAEGAKNIALVCKEYSVTLIHISTDYVFDGEKETPYTIVDIPNPINEYGKSKWEGEKHIQEILSNYVIIRTSWLYHKRHGRNFYKTILEKANKGETLYVTDEQVGCPTDAANLAEYIVKIIMENTIKCGVNHFTSGDIMTWHGFANLILTENNLDVAIKLMKNLNFTNKIKRPRNSILLNSKI
jgi:dTDP-4-dehydrorhamnose reductase